MLRAGIVGLPNVGKSTLFNAVTKTRKAPAENYPFCTIEPNVGIVNVPDPRLERLAKLAKSPKTTPTAIELADIAGLVKGASQGEGLGNQFLHHIREVDAIIQVARCFEDENVHHVSGSIDPLCDIEVILTELVLADLASVQKRAEKTQKAARGPDKQAKAELPVLEKLAAHLDTGAPAAVCALSDDEQKLARDFFLLTMKPTLFACNVQEKDLAELAQGDRSSAAGRHILAVEEYCKKNLGAESILISAQIESDLVELPEEEQKEYLSELGVTESGVSALIRAVYRLLGLRTFLTTNEKETHAWTIAANTKAPQAAGAIHTDFERGFIAAETIHYDELIRFGSFAKAREAGKLRIEGKEYLVQDGDIIEFRFNV